MTFQLRIPGGASVLAALLALALSACGDSPSESGPGVASVTIEPPVASLAVGTTLQLSATVRSSNGSVITSVPVTWSSENQGVATVNTSGRIAGIEAGTTRIIAQAGTRADTITVTVTVPSPIVVTGISPDPLQAGVTATITGEGFSTTASANTVTIGGVAAPVQSATATTLTVVVPASVCATSAVVVRVSVAGMIGERTHPWQGAPPLQVAAGQQLRLDPAATYCLSLSTGQYLLGVQSVSGVATSLTPAVVRGLPAGAAAGAPHVAAAQQRLPWLQQPAAGLRLPQGREQRLLERHREAELAFRRAERRFLAMHRPSAGRRVAATADARAASGEVVASVPGTAVVGDTVDLKYPRTPNFCAEFTAIRGVVRHVGTRGIWVEDVTNPPGGFTLAEYQALGAQFDGHIYATDVEYFGEPTDYDGNGRIVILITKEINNDGVLGRVFSVDFFPEDCASSNDGEIFYGIAPDPTGAVADTITHAFALREMPPIIAHELAHVIQFGRRLETPGATHWPTIWELEGQATLAEEVVGHSITGRQPRQDYGFAVGWGAEGSAEQQWYRSPFIDLALYFGFQTQTSKVPGAPEQCGWLGRPEGGNLGPCLGERSLYGVSWSFLRWVSDHYGPQFPGGEQGFHRSMIAATDTGFVTISRLTGEPIDRLLARWSASLYTDNLIPGADPQLNMLSWRLHDIFDALVEPARLRPYERTMTNFTDNVQVRAGSTAYFRIGATAAGSISVTGPSAAALPPHMRVWLVRMQ